MGAAGGALGGALTDFGINDQFMKQLAESIHPGEFALFVLIREMTADKVVEQIKHYGGVVLKTSLADAKDAGASPRSRQRRGVRSGRALTAEPERRDIKAAALPP